MEFNVMGIDPGSRNIGVSIFTVRPVGTNSLDLELEIVNVKTMTLYIDSDSTSLYDNVVARTNKLKRYIRSIYYVYDPVITAMESSFINMSRLGAVLPLTKAIHTIESTLIELDRNNKIVSIPPGLIKRMFGAEQKGKDSVLLALKKKKELVKLIEDVDTITEHEVDATAIGYTLLEYLKNNGGLICIRGLQI